MTDICNKT